MTIRAFSLVKKGTTILTVAAFLFTAVAAPWVEAGFWEDRQKSSSRLKGDEPPQYAGLPSSLRDLQQALPSVDGVLSRVSRAPEQSLRDPKLAGLPGWLTSLSTAYGEIRDAHVASPGSPLVVHVQDVHGYAEAQQNISQMIRDWSVADQVSLIGVEGAVGGFDLSSYRGLSDKDAVRGAADLLMDQHLIAGPEHAAWTAADAPALWGVEDRALYLANVQAHRDSRAHRDFLAAQFKAWDAALSRLKTIIYTPALAEFDRNEALYRDGGLGLGEYVASLYKTASPAAGRFPNLDLFLSAVGRESSMDFAAVEKDRARLVEVLSRSLSSADLSSLVEKSLLHRMGRLSYGRYHEELKSFCARNGVALSSFPRMAEYVEYVLLSERIRRERIFPELKALEAAALKPLLKTDEQRDLRLLTEDAARAAQVAGFVMTPDDWRAYEAVRARVGELPARLSRLAASRGVTFSGAADVAAALKPGEDFCAAALRRNEAIVENLLAAMKSGRRPAAVLVAGGFHTDGMTALLREKGASYVVVTPKIKQIKKGGDHYLDFLLDKTPLEQLFTVDKITLAKALVGGALDPLAPGRAELDAVFVASYVAGRVAARGPDFSTESLVEELRRAFPGVKPAVYEAPGDVVRVTVAYGAEGEELHIVTSPGDKLSAAGQKVLKSVNGGKTKYGVSGARAFAVAEGAPGLFARMSRVLAEWARKGGSAAGVFALAGLSASSGDSMTPSLSIPSSGVALMAASLVTLGVTAVVARVGRPLGASVRRVAAAAFLPARAFLRALALSALLVVQACGGDGAGKPGVQAPGGPNILRVDAREGEPSYLAPLDEVRKIAPAVSLTADAERRNGRVTHTAAWAPESGTFAGVSVPLKDARGVVTFNFLRKAGEDRRVVKVVNDQGTESAEYEFKTPLGQWVRVDVDLSGLPATVKASALDRLIVAAVGLDADKDGRPDTLSAGSDSFDGLISPARPADAGMGGADAGAAPDASPLPEVLRLAPGGVPQPTLIAPLDKVVKIAPAVSLKADAERRGGRLMHRLGWAPESGSYAGIEVPLKGDERSIAFNLEQLSGANEHHVKFVDAAGTEYVTVRFTPAAGAVTGAELDLSKLPSTLGRPVKMILAVEGKMNPDGSRARLEAGEDRIDGIISETQAPDGGVAPVIAAVSADDATRPAPVFDGRVSSIGTVSATEGPARVAGGNPVHGFTYVAGGNAGGAFEYAAPQNLSGAAVVDFRVRNDNLEAGPDGAIRLEVKFVDAGGREQVVPVSVPAAQWAAGSWKKVSIDMSQVVVDKSRVQRVVVAALGVTRAGAFSVDGLAKNTAPSTIPPAAQTIIVPAADDATLPAPVFDGSVTSISSVSAKPNPARAAGGNAVHEFDYVPGDNAGGLFEFSQPQDVRALASFDFRVRNDGLEAGADGLIRLEVKLSDASGQEQRVLVAVPAAQWAAGTWKKLPVDLSQVVIDKSRLKRAVVSAPGITRAGGFAVDGLARNTAAPVTPPASQGIIAPAADDATLPGPVFRGAVTSISSISAKSNPARAAGGFPVVELDYVPGDNAGAVFEYAAAKDLSATPVLDFRVRNDNLEAGADGLIRMEVKVVTSAGREQRIVVSVPAAEWAAGAWKKFPVDLSKVVVDLKDVKKFIVAALGVTRAGGFSVDGLVSPTATAALRTAPGRRGTEFAGFFGLPFLGLSLSGRSGRRRLVAGLLGAGAVVGLLSFLGALPLQLLSVLSVGLIGGLGMVFSGSDEKARAVAAFKANPRPVALDSRLQLYDWGDKGFIPALLGFKNPDGKPVAELWMGAHPSLPSEALLGGVRVPLNELIALTGPETLGQSVLDGFQGRLPFLFKVLSAGKPLSIQVHPDKSQAEGGFAREQASGMARERRHYKDDNHKPERIVAVTDFYGLRGFRPASELAGLAREVPELAGLLQGRDLSTAEGLKGFYDALMSPADLSPEESDRILGAILARLAAEDKVRPFAKTDARHWFLRAHGFFPKGQDGRMDRGLYSVFLLNLIHLKPGQSMYLGAGVLHAYLEGTGMETMANSDNVLRGGLTPKLVDPAELSKTVKFVSEKPDVQDGRRVSDTETAYQQPGDAPEFQVSRIELDAARAHGRSAEHGAEIVVLMTPGAEATLSFGAESIAMKPGYAVFVPQGVPYSLSSSSEVVLFRSSAPRPGGFRGREPKQLAFGTSGLRGDVVDITHLETYINAKGYLNYLLDNKLVKKGDKISIAGDLRPSTQGEHEIGGVKGGRIMQAVAKAIQDAGLVVDNQGEIPTPALAYHAMRSKQASIMITGSHIEFHMNGIKFYRPDGEVLKADEAPIMAAVAKVRAEEYARPAAESHFKNDGWFKDGAMPALPPSDGAARQLYIKRYQDVFPQGSLQGLRVALYQHSSVGRDVIQEILEWAGVEVVPIGRTDTFVPIDTEDIKKSRQQQIQEMFDRMRAERRAAGLDDTFDALLSGDGDFDRPMVEGVDENGNLVFIGGDILGIQVAKFLGADAVAITNSATDDIERQLEGVAVVLPRTKIGSPHVIKAMNDAKAQGRFKRIVSWESNGGFLMASPIPVNGAVLEPLPTRDATTVHMAILTLAKRAKDAGSKRAVVDVTMKETRRVVRTANLSNFPRETAKKIVAASTPSDAGVLDVFFAAGGVVVSYKDGRPSRTLPADDGLAAELQAVRAALEGYYTPEMGYAGGIVRLNYEDAVKMFFGNGDVSYFRGSGNEDKFKQYNNALPARVEEMLALAESASGPLRRMEKDIAALPAGARLPVAAPLSPPQMVERAVEAVREAVGLAPERGDTPAVEEQSEETPAAPALAVQEELVVLMADDEPMITRTFSRILPAGLRRAGFPSFRILTAENGAQALALAEKEPVSVLLTDYNMPLMTGPELIQKLRERVPGLPAILMSGGERDREGALGSSDRLEVPFLAKPFGADDLLKRVSAMAFAGQINRDLADPRRHDALADHLKGVLSASASTPAEMRVMAAQALTVLSWRRRGVPGADQVRVTGAPAEMLRALDRDRGESFLSRALPGVSVAEQEGDLGAYDRGRETFEKMSGNALDSLKTDAAAFAAAVKELPLYSMLHGFVMPSRELAAITTAEDVRGRERETVRSVSTIHETSFMLDRLPHSSQVPSTGDGHFQGDKLDVKHVTEGAGYQVLVKYAADGSIEKVLTHKLAAGAWTVALPGYVDYMIGSSLRFNDVTVRVSAEVAQAVGAGRAPPAGAKAPLAGRLNEDGTLSLVPDPSVAAPVPAALDEILDGAEAFSAFGGKDGLLKAYPALTPDDVERGVQRLAVLLDGAVRVPAPAVAPSVRYTPLSIPRVTREEAAAYFSGLSSRKKDGGFAGLSVLALIGGAGSLGASLWAFAAGAPAAVGLMILSAGLLIAAAVFKGGGKRTTPTAPAAAVDDAAEKMAAEMAAKYWRGDLGTTVIDRPFRMGKKQDVPFIGDISAEEARRFQRLAVESLSRGSGVIVAPIAGEAARMNPAAAPESVKALVGGKAVLSKAAVSLGTAPDGKEATYLGEMLTDVSLMFGEVDRAAKTAGRSGGVWSNDILFMSNDAFRAEHDALLESNGNFGLKADQLRFFHQPLGAKFKATPADVEAARAKGVFKTDVEYEAAKAAALSAQEAFERGDYAALISDERAPLGHGEFFHQLIANGELLHIVDSGKEWLYFRNIDNVAAKFDKQWLTILGYFLENGLDMSPEVSRRGPGVKGGSHIVMLDDGSQQFVEDPGLEATAKAKGLKVSPADSYWINNAASFMTPRYIASFYRRKDQSFEEFISELRAASPAERQAIAERGRRKFPSLLDAKPAKSGQGLAVKRETNLWQSTSLVEPGDGMKVQAVGVNGTMDFPIERFESLSPSEQEKALAELRFLGTKNWEKPAEDLEKARVVLQKALGRPVTDREVLITLDSYVGNKPVMDEIIRYNRNVRRVDPDILKNPATMNQAPAADLSRAFAVVMAGGASSRFWPLNKVFSDFLDQAGLKRSMIRQTFDRATSDPSTEGVFLPAGRFFVVTGKDAAPTIKDQLPMPAGNVLVEPGRRNTLPAILWTLAHIRRENPDATVSILTSDHVIGETAVFRETVARAAAVAQSGPNVVTIGIQPSGNPQEWTDFGAINAGKEADGGSLAIAAFEEKPSVSRATEMISGAEGKWFWNAGMFVFNVKTLERALELHQPDMYRTYKAMADAVEAGRDAEAAARFNDLPGKIKHPITGKDADNSIDFAVMMQLKAGGEIQGRVIPGVFPWKDVGSWSAVRGVLPADKDGNIFHGDSAAAGSRSSVLVAEKGRSIRADGIEGLVVVAAANGDVLVAPEARASEIKPLVAEAQKAKPGDGVRVESENVSIDNAGPGVVGVFGVKDLAVSVSSDGRVTVRGASSPVPASDPDAGVLQDESVRSIVAEMRRGAKDWNASVRELRSRLSVPGADAWGMAELRLWAVRASEGASLEAVRRSQDVLILWQVGILSREGARRWLTTLLEAEKGLKDAPADAADYLVFQAEHPNEAHRGERPASFDAPAARSEAKFADRSEAAAVSPLPLSPLWEKVMSPASVRSPSVYPALAAAEVLALGAVMGVMLYATGWDFSQGLSTGNLLSFLKSALAGTVLFVGALHVTSYPDFSRPKSVTTLRGLGSLGLDGALLSAVLGAPLFAATVLAGAQAAPLALAAGVAALGALLGSAAHVAILRSRQGPLSREGYEPLAPPVSAPAPAGLEVLVPAVADGHLRDARPVRILYGETSAGALPALPASSLSAARSRALTDELAAGDVAALWLKADAAGKAGLIRAARGLSLGDRRRLHQAVVLDAARLHAEGRSVFTGAPLDLAALRDESVALLLTLGRELALPVENPSYVRLLADAYTADRRAGEIARTPEIVQAPGVGARLVRALRGFVSASLGGARVYDFVSLPLETGGRLSPLATEKGVDRLLEGLWQAVQTRDVERLQRFVLVAEGDLTADETRRAVIDRLAAKAPQGVPASAWRLSVESSLNGLYGPVRVLERAPFRSVDGRLDMAKLGKALAGGARWQQLLWRFLVKFDVRALSVASLDLDAVRDLVRLFIIDLLGEVKQVPLDAEAQKDLYLMIQA